MSLFDNKTFIIIYCYTYQMNFIDIWIKMVYVHVYYLM